jgi:tetratricopeptide (TPR) repeat protein
MRLGRSILGYVVCILLLFTIACNSKPANDEAKSVSSSAEQNKPTAAGSAQPAEQPSGAPEDPNAISYAKNPDRFVQQKTVAPAFNLTNPKTATDFFDVGVHEDNLHHYDKAIAAYEQALKLKPDWALLCFREAKDYQRMGRKDDTIAQFKRATKVDPHYWDAYAELARAYKDTGDTNHAIQAASKLLDFPPLQVPTHNQLGYWYEELGDKQSAKQQFEMYRDLSQKSKTEPKTDRYQAALRELQKLSQ